MLGFLKITENKPDNSFFPTHERLALRETNYGLEGYLFEQVGSDILFELFTSAYEGGRVIYFEVFKDSLQIGTNIRYIQKNWINVDESLLDENLALVERTIEAEDNTKIVLSSQFIFMVKAIRQGMQEYEKNLTEL